MKAARNTRERIALRPQVPQSPTSQLLFCEDCGDPATADDFIQGLHAVLCSICLERLMDAEQPEQQL